MCVSSFLWTIVYFWCPFFGPISIKGFYRGNLVAEGPGFSFFFSTTWLNLFNLSSRSGKFCLNSRKRQLFIHAQIDISWVSYSEVQDLIFVLVAGGCSIVFVFPLSLGWQTLWCTWMRRHLFFLLYMYLLACLYVSNARCETHKSSQLSLIVCQPQCQTEFRVCRSCTANPTILKEEILFITYSAWECIGLKLCCEEKHWEQFEEDNTWMCPLFCWLSFDTYNERKKCQNHIAACYMYIYIHTVYTIIHIYPYFCTWVDTFAHFTFATTAVTAVT